MESESKTAEPLHRTCTQEENPELYDIETRAIELFGSVQRTLEWLDRVQARGGIIDAE